MHRLELQPDAFDGLRRGVLVHAGRVKFFVDGDGAGTADAGPNVIRNAGVLGLGGAGGAETDDFRGRLHHATLYTGGLEDSRIATLTHPETLTMKALLLPLCFGVLALAGCSFLTGVDHLHGDGGSKPDAGIATLCSGADVVYCNDFDQGNLNAQEVQTNGGGSAVLDSSDAYSKPRSLLCSGGGAGPFGAAFLYDGGASVPVSMRLEFRARIAAAAADQIQLAVLMLGKPPAARTYTIVVGTGAAPSLRLDESDGPTTVPHTLTSAVLLDGGWHQVSLALDANAIVVSFDGASPQTIPTKWTPRPMTAYVGARQFSLASTSVRIDDIVVHASL